MRVKVAQADAIGTERGLCAKAGNVSLMIVRTADGIHAVENKCPHLGLSFGKGKVEGHDIVCPFHGSRFDVRTGENTDWVAAVAGIKIPVWTRALLSFGKKPQPVRTFPVSVEGNDVFVEV